MPTAPPPDVIHGINYCFEVQSEIAYPYTELVRGNVVSDRAMIKNVRTHCVPMAVPVTVIDIPVNKNALIGGRITCLGDFCHRTVDDAK